MTWGVVRHTAARRYDRGRTSRPAGRPSPRQSNSSAERHGCPQPARFAASVSVVQLSLKHNQTTHLHRHTLVLN